VGEDAYFFFFAAFFLVPFFLAAFFFATKDHLLKKTTGDSCATAEHFWAGFSSPGSPDRTHRSRVRRVSLTHVDQAAVVPCVVLYRSGARLVFNSIAS
jgi:hypothetical protein